MSATITIGDKALGLDEFVKIAQKHAPIEIAPEALVRIRKSRERVNEIVKSGAVVYGINTGFGSLSTKQVSPSELDLLQRNLIVSHAIGCGDPAPVHIVRGMLLLRLVSICRGCSGVRVKVARRLAEALNKNFIPYVPMQGTVGASGDLAPLSHMILGLLGEGNALDVTKTISLSAEEVMSGNDLGQMCYIEAKYVLEQLKMKPLVLKAKEGLALNNGTQFITTHAAFATYHALNILEKSTMVAAITIEALHGTNKAFDARIHEVKPHTGQVQIAKDLRDLLCPNGVNSEIHETHTKTKVQDAYSLRCIAQIHGTSYDLVKFVEKIVLTEMNSANDNPLIFEDAVLSGGNFHGMYIGMATDQLALAMSYLCNISERRLERIMSPSLNGFLPSFLTTNPGLNSGFMIAQYASAGVTAENRCLANPGSVHNIPTCQGTEDVVSMAGFSARKSVISVENTYKVLAYELLAAVNAHRHTKEHMHPHLDSIVQHISVGIKMSDTDSYLKEHLDFVLNFLKN